MSDSPIMPDLRRSTRVSLEVSIQVEGQQKSMRGTTVVVSLHGALIHTESPLELHSRILLTVYITGKQVNATVVYKDSSDSLKAGIELEVPQNIWGISLAPDDWEGHTH
jgi:hypothetical protein